MIHVSLGRWFPICGDEDWVDGDGAITIKALLEELIDPDVGGGVAAIPDDICPDCMRISHRALEKVRRSKGHIQ